MFSALLQPVHMPDNSLCMLGNLSKTKNFVSAAALYILVLRLKPDMRVQENMVLEKNLMML